MNNTSRQNWLNLEHNKKGSALVMVRCQLHFNERSDHSVRLRLIDEFSDLRTTLLPTGVHFHFDHLSTEQRSIAATVPIAEIKLFQDFLRKRHMGMSLVRVFPSTASSTKPKVTLRGI